MDSGALRARETREPSGNLSNEFWQWIFSLHVVAGGSGLRQPGGRPLDVTEASGGCLFTIWHRPAKLKSGF